MGLHRPGGRWPPCLSPLNVVERDGQALTSLPPQEEIYVWSKHYAFEDCAAAALDAVLAFTPSIPNWAYMGSALGIGEAGTKMVPVELAGC